MSSPSTTALPRWVTIARDVISYLGGWALIGYQVRFVAPSDVNEWFLLIGGSLIGVPGIAEFFAMRSRTAAQQSSHPAPDSSAVQP